MGKPRDGRHRDLFRPALEQIIDLGHPLLPTRLVAGLFILKHAHNLSDEVLCSRWVENPYYQYFCGEQVFQHELPFDRSSLTRWRQRLGAEHLVALIRESLAVAHKTGALAIEDLERVAVDTTVQPKAVAHPTDARLMHRALEKLNGVDPGTWLADVLKRLPGHPVKRIAELLPWNWKPEPATLAA